MRKEKNLIFIESEKMGGEYCININNGVVTSPKGKVITVRNKEIMTALQGKKWRENNTFTNALYNWFDRNPYGRADTLGELQLAEKLYNMGFTKISIKANSEDIDFINQHSKEFFKWIDTFNKDSWEHIPLWDFETSLKKMQFREFHKNDLPSNCENYSRLIEDIYNDSKYRELSDKDKKTFVNLIFKQVLPFYENILYDYSVYSIVHKVKELFIYAEFLEVEVDRKEFFKQYMALKKCYNVSKAEYDRVALEKNQLKHKALAFENDLFEVVIPTKEEQFKEEGKIQHNCVYSAYYPRVIDGKTNVVFIRKKDDVNTPYITCEVQNGRIIQYLGRHNSSIRDNLAIEFKILYAEHLRREWA